MLLDRYREHECVFNDDIQGTGATIVTGLMCALKVLGKPADEIKNLKVVMLGAGSAGCGVADSIASAQITSGNSREQAIDNIFLVDKDGLMTKKRQ